MRTEWNATQLHVGWKFHSSSDPTHLTLLGAVQSVSIDLGAERLSVVFKPVSFCGMMLTATPCIQSTSCAHKNYVHIMQRTSSQTNI